MHSAIQSDTITQLTGKNSPGLCTDCKTWVEISNVMSPMSHYKRETVDLPVSLGPWTATILGERA